MWANLTGPWFSYLCVGGSIVCVVAAALWARGLGRGRPESAELSDYEVAFLAGGPDRVGDTVLANLFESGRLRVNARGRLYGRGPMLGDDTLTRAAITVAEATDATFVKRAVCRSTAMRRLYARLIRRGLAVDVLRKRRAWNRLVVLSLVLATTVAAAGFASSRYLAALGFPILFLTTVLLAASLPGLHLTPAGWAALRRERAESESSARAPVSRTVALAGFDAYPDDETKATGEVRPLVWPRRRFPVVFGLGQNRSMEYGGAHFASGWTDGGGGDSGAGGGGGGGSGGDS